MGAQNFSFTFKFPQNGVFQPQILHVGRTFSYKKKVFGFRQFSDCINWVQLSLCYVDEDWVN